MDQLPLFGGKICRICQKWKPYESFHHDKKIRDGFVTQCKDCVRAYQHNLYKNPSPRKPAARDFKQCTHCKIVKPAEDFGWRSGKRYGENRYLRSTCFECTRAAGGKWSKQNRQAAHLTNRRTTLRRSYGLTMSEYDALLKKQHGKCAICGTTDSGSTKKRYLSVDHDHETDAIRGLLCSPCNVAVGFLRDDPELAARVVDYLKAHADRAPNAVIYIRDGKKIVGNG